MVFPCTTAPCLLPGQKFLFISYKHALLPCNPFAWLRLHLALNAFRTEPTSLLEATGRYGPQIFWLRRCYISRKPKFCRVLTRCKASGLLLHFLLHLRLHLRKSQWVAKVAWSPSLALHLLLDILNLGLGPGPRAARSGNNGKVWAPMGLYYSARLEHPSCIDGFGNLKDILWQTSIRSLPGNTTGPLHRGLS